MSGSSILPSPLGALTLGPRVLARCFKAPRSLLLVAGSMLALSLIELWPLQQKTAALLDHTPGAAGRFGRELWEEMGRVHPDTRLTLGASGIAALLLWMFFAGGVIALVGRGPEYRCRVGALLAAGGRFFFRSFRCWLVFAVLLVAWSWVTLGVLEPRLQPLLLVGGFEPAQFRYDVGVSLVWALGFAVLLVLRRSALAWIVLQDRRSAVRAWASAVWLLVRRPLRTAAAYGGLFVLWGVGLAASGLAIDRLLETGRLPWALLVGLAALVWYQACVMGSWVLARRMWVLNGLLGDPLAEENDTEATSDFVDVARTVH